MTKKGKSRSLAAVEPWIEARRRFRLTHEQVQMARELGMNPKTLGKIANPEQERWKAPLPLFIEELYLRRFGRARPERSLSLEARAREIDAKKRERRERRLQRRMARAALERGDPAPRPEGLERRPSESDGA
jgi:hypothetical protein